jgi:hypothetical protein
MSRLRARDGRHASEAQVFESWYFATKVKKVSKGRPTWQKLVRQCIRLFPRVRSVSRAEQKRIGLQALNKALDDPSLRMEFKRAVELPSKNVPT